MHSRIHLALAVALCLCHPLAAQGTPGPAPVASVQLLKTGTTWNGVPIRLSLAGKPEIQSVIVEIAPGAATVWHKHPVNNIAYILAGTIRLELEDGTTRPFKAGDAFAEVVDTWHRGVNTGSGPLRILVVYVGEQGTPISVVKDAQPAE